MNDKELRFTKKRDIGEIITDSFEFIKQEHQPILKLFATYVLPFIILYGIVQGYLQKNVISKIDFSNAETLMANIGPVYLNIFLFSMFGLFVQSLLIATYYTYIDIYVKKGKGNFELSEITTHLFSNGLLALGAAFAMFLVVSFGLLMFLLPGIYFANTLSIIFIIYIFEKRGLANALVRSVILVNTQWWKTFFVNVIGIIMVWGGSFILSFPLFIAGIPGNSSVLESTSEIVYPDWYWIFVVLSTIISAFFWIVPYTFLAMQYFNLAEHAKPLRQPSENQEQ